MPCHALSRRDRNFVSLLTVGFLDRTGFKFVVVLRRCAVGVDVAHVTWCDASFIDHIQHGCAKGFTLRVRRGNVISIASRTVASDFADYVRATRFGVLERFHYEHAGTFTHNKAIATIFKRPTGGSGVFVIACAHGLH